MQNMCLGFESLLLQLAAAARALSVSFKAVVATKIEAATNS